MSWGWGEEGPVLTGGEPVKLFLCPGLGVKDTVSIGDGDNKIAQIKTKHETSQIKKAGVVGGGGQVSAQQV